jgi:hypothetical protein
MNLIAGIYKNINQHPINTHLCIIGSTTIETSIKGVE